jgi:hypothetical protein
MLMITPQLVEKLEIVDPKRKRWLATAPQVGEVVALSVTISRRRHAIIWLR